MKEVVERSKGDFFLKYYFLFFVVAWHSYLTVQSGSTGNLGLIVLAFALAMIVSLQRRLNNMLSPGIEGFRISVRYTTVFLVITGIKHFVSSSSFTEALVSLALFITLAMIVEAVLFALDRTFAWQPG